MNAQWLFLLLLNRQCRLCFGLAGCFGSWSAIRHIFSHDSRGATMAPRAAAACPHTHGMSSVVWRSFHVPCTCHVRGSLHLAASQAVFVRPAGLWLWFVGSGDGCGCSVLGGVLGAMRPRLPNAHKCPFARCAVVLSVCARHVHANSAWPWALGRDSKKSTTSSNYRAVLSAGLLRVYLDTDHCFRLDSGAI